MSFTKQKNVDLESKLLHLENKLLKGKGTTKKSLSPKKVVLKLKTKKVKQVKLVKLINKKLRYIDLFCGIGSFHTSFSKLGFECVMACDIDKAVRDTYKENYGITPLQDIVDIDPKKVPAYDILCAGFPCQPFSQAGKQKGFKDERGTMFFHVMKFIKINQPSVVVLENVAGLLNHDSGKTMSVILQALGKQNYTVIYDVLKCSDYGIPQMRKRLFIICFKNTVKCSKNIDKFFDLESYKGNVSLSKYFNKKFEKETAYTIRCGGRLSPIKDRHNWDGYIVNGKEYRLTIDDAKKLQGFPSTYKLIGTNSQKWKMLGNTIPTIFSHIVGKQILATLF